MPNVFLIPAGGKGDKVAEQHFQQCILNPKRLTDLTKLTPQEFRDLSSIAEPGGVRLWGSNEADDGRHIKRWEMMEPGDIALFIRHNGIWQSEVLTTFRNRAQATALWNVKTTNLGKSQAWELMMVLGKPSQLALTKRELNDLCGYAPNANVQEFKLVPAGRLDPVLNALDREADSSTVSSAVPKPKRKLRDKILPTDVEDMDVADRLRVSYQRAEQTILRRYLLQGDTGTCALCESDFPIGLLAAAHIKRRSACSDDEKRDIKNVAMPNCKFGCDELWERGYISVDGQGQLMHAPTATADLGARVTDYLSTKLQPGKVLTFFKGEKKRLKYAAWHRDNRLRS